MFNKSAMQDTGWLVLRVGIGVMFMVFGFGKLKGGPDQWAALGGSMAVFGVTVAPTFWGFMAAFSECFGGLALVTGVLFRPFAFLMFFTMLMSTD